MKMEHVLTALDYIVSEYKLKQKKTFLVYIFINNNPCIILSDSDIQEFIDSIYMTSYFAKKSCELKATEFEAIEQLMIDIEVTI